LGVVGLNADNKKQEVHGLCLYYISNTVAGGIYRQKIIDYPYNFKMIRSSAFFLFVLFLALEA